MYRKGLFLGLCLLFAICTIAARRDRAVSPEGAAIARLVYQTYGGNFANYVGSETCLACHSGPRAVDGYDASGWKSTLHARPFNTVPDDRDTLQLARGVIADSNRNGVDDFKEGLDLASTPAFAKYGANAPKLGFDAGGYFVTIGGLRFDVFFTWGARTNATASSATLPASR